MAQIIREIRVDVSQPNVFQAIVAKQLDCNSRFLKITLVDFGVKIEVPETAKVTINANRPDGKSQSFVGVANNDGTITVPLAQWMLEVAGELKCDVSVINTTDNKRLTSTDFFVNVQEAANKSTDISENPDGEIRVITPTQKIDNNSSDDEYPSAKAVYELDNITATASGSAITIDSAKAPLQQLKLYGKTEQNGTPTPDAPVPLVSVGDSGSFEVGVYGKNLLNANQSYFLDVPQHLFPDYLPILLKANTSYTVSLKSTVSGATELILCNREKVKVNSILFDLIANQTSVYTFYPTEDIYFLRWYVNISNVTLTNLQLELGTQATDYEPCNKQTLTMPYTLEGADGYNTEIDFLKCMKTNKIYTFTINGNEGSWSYDSTMKYFRFFPYKEYGILPVRAMGLSSHFPNKPNTDLSFFVSGGQLQLGIYDYNGKWGASVDNFKTWLSQNNVTFVLPLETPIETPLTETELNAYRQLYTNKGNTTILSECEDAEITYYINKPNAQAIGNIHSQVNKDYIKLQQAIISLGGSTL